MYGNPLTFSGTPLDITFVGLLRLVYNPPSKDSQLVISAEQALPLKPDWLFFNRLQVPYQSKSSKQSNTRK
jgi:outer membrane protein insertion porin family